MSNSVLEDQNIGPEAIYNFSQCEATNAYGEAWTRALDAADLWDAVLELAGKTPPWVGYPTEQAAELIDGLLVAADAVRERIPAELHEAASDFRANGNEYGAMIIQGFIPPDGVERYSLFGDKYKIAPNSSSFPDQHRVGRAMGILSIAVAGLFGPPITYSTNPAGAADKIVTSVAPVSGDQQTVLASTAEVGWHTEVSTSVWRPDMLGLFCIRGEPGVKTGVLTADRIFQELDDNTLEVLAQPRFRQSDGLVAKGAGRPCPIILEVDGRRAIACHQKEPNGKLEATVWEPDDWIAAESLDRFTVALDTARPTFHELQDGQSLWINNDGPHCRRWAADSQGGVSLPRLMFRVLTGGERHLRQGTIIDPDIAYSSV